MRVLYHEEEFFDYSGAQLERKIVAFIIREKGEKKKIIKIYDFEIFRFIDAALLSS